ncbi:NACHT domain-containing protein [Kineosporia babensis]|uniref:AAA+ ATPase domain-containing protein n=1 Tax=Kineosporia babensis TaxID=499548 RepID=A0A9X1NQC2_9ACTN|nr:hypothetical protein [Kineosporia babensis]MCD5317238.1 hypothetical protein [Kineosporia babensis]
MSQPQNVIAVVVGIETYPSLPSGWDVNGPALDAARFAAHLRGQGVPDSNIFLHVAPLAKNEAILDELCPGLVRHSATRDDVRDRLTGGLPSRTGCELIVFWGSHGLIAADGSQRLLYANATEHDKRNLHVEDLLHYFARDNRFPISKFIVDACAVPENEKWHSLLPLERLPPRLHRDQKRPNWQLLKATAWGRAYQDDAKRTGRFSEFVLGCFGEAAERNDEWPPSLVEVYHAAVPYFVSLARAGVRHQAPALFGVLSPDFTQDCDLSEDGASSSEGSFARAKELLARLQDLNERTRRSAGSVSSTRLSSLTKIRDDFADGLYVQRDQERSILNHLRADDPVPVIVVGEPGVGKTSVLWGISSHLEDEPDTDVRMLSAGDVRQGTDGGGSLRDMLAVWLSSTGRAGQRPVLILDTVDLLAQDADLLELQDVVRLAIEGGANVLLSSRPAEASHLPSSWRREPLGPYAEEPREAETGEPLSEFERAVAAHALHYHGGSIKGTELVSQLTHLVSRRYGTKDLCLRPLTLRMLFEVYTQVVPPNIDTTGLYLRYWRSRVQEDRRDWSRLGGQMPPPESNRDLSETARRIGAEMLKQGEVRIVPDLIPHRGPDDPLFHEIELLEMRGVIDRDRDRISFFHQTFFEFAAGRYLVETYPATGLRVALDRARSRPEDYFLLSVVEQTWLFAWGYEPTQGTAVALAQDCLTELSYQQTLSHEGEQTEAEYSFDRVAISVTSQASTAPPELNETLAKVISRSDLPIVKHMLSRLPAPGRHHQPSDDRLLKACVARDDAAWITVLSTVERMSVRDVGQAVDTFNAIGLPSKLRRLDAERISERREFLRLMVRLLPSSPGPILDMIKECFGRLGNSAARSYFDRMVDEMRATRIAPGESVLVWAGHLVAEAEKVKAKQKRDKTRDVGVPPAPTARNLLDLYTLMHIHGHTETADLVRQVDQFEESLRSEATKISLDARARTASLLAALADAPAEIVQRLLNAVENLADANTIAWWGNGVFATAMTKSPHFQALAERWLVEGLPAEPGRTPELASRRADLVRRSLESPSMPPEAVAQVVSRVVPRSFPAPFSTVNELWLRTDGLMTVLVRAVAAGDATAADAWSTALADVAALSPGQRKLLIRCVKDLGGAELGWPEAIHALIQLGAIEVLADRTDPKGPGSRPPFTLFQPHVALLEQQILAGRRAKSSDEQRAAYRLWRHLVEAGVLPMPEWSAVRDDYLGRREPGIRENLVLIASAGVRVGQYDWRAVVALAKEGTAFQRGPEHDAAWRVAVRLRSIWDEESAWEDLLETALLEPIETGALASVGSFLNSRHRRGAEPSMNTKLALLEALGRRLTSDTQRTRVGHDLAASWSQELTALVTEASAEQQLRLLRSFPHIHPDFAASIALMLQPSRYPELKPTMQRYLNDRHRVGDRARDNLRETLALLATTRPDSTWSNLYEDLKQPLPPLEYVSGPSNGI